MTLTLVAQVFAWASLALALLNSGIALGKGKLNDSIVRLVDGALSVLVLGVLMGWWA